LGEALPLLFSAARTGRLFAHEDDLPPLDVWLERGRVLHATWGPLRALSALEMAALLPPRVACEFVDGEHTPTRTLDLSAIDVAARLAEVARVGGKLAAAIPSIEAVPRRTLQRARGLDRDAARLLEQVDGARTIAELTAGRQPLAVVRGLVGLVGQGLVTFDAAASEDAPLVPEPEAVHEPEPRLPPPEPEPEPSPPPTEPEPEAALTPVAAAAAIAPPAPEPEPALESNVVPLTGPVPSPPADETRRVDTRQGVPVNVGLAALALVIAVALWFAVQRMQAPPTDSVAGVQATLVASATPLALAGAAPTTPPTPAPTAVSTSVPTTPPTAAPTQPPTSVPTLEPTSPPSAAPTSPPPTSVPTPAPTTPPTSVPTAPPTTPPTSVPTVDPTPPPTVAPTPAPTAVATSAPVTTASASAPLLDETFASGADGWPSAATSSAFWDTSGYHLVPRIAAQFVAITAPSGPSFTNGAVLGLFRKVAGPVGGGYGLIVRAQGPLDGSDQGGRYYIFEVGDKGEVGAWRRESDQWVDLLPWQASAAVNAGAAENRLRVVAAGSQFTFSVNDTPVAQVSDATLASGGVGVFTGGDGNQVLLERFTVATQ
jgi:hypothetical protein